jgi:DNA repair protein RecN (Recombination protein N)
LQLAVQSVGAARGRRRRTLVFDEVDAGIGGRTAESVGRKLRKLAERDQVFCVTHVPQIAALADRHFRAEKTETRGRTIAAVRLLEGKERVAELARMLAGEKVPETALRHARELLAQAEER